MSRLPRLPTADVPEPAFLPPAPALSNPSKEGKNGSALNRLVLSFSRLTFLGRDQPLPFLVLPWWSAHLSERIACSRPAENRNPGWKRTGSKRMGLPLPKQKKPLERRETKLSFPSPAGPVPHILKSTGETFPDLQSRAHDSGSTLLSFLFLHRPTGSTVSGSHKKKLLFAGGPPFHFLPSAQFFRDWELFFPVCAPRRFPLFDPGAKFRHSIIPERRT